MRMHGHAAHDDMKYVPKEQVEEWRKRDPIDRQEARLREIGVDVDAECPRSEYRVKEDRFLASPYARPIAGVPVEANLNGISFAVANFTGLLVANPDSILTTWSAMSAKATR